MKKLHEQIKMHPDRIPEGGEMHYNPMGGDSAPEGFYIPVNDSQLLINKQKQ